jgi:YD repeat-containing protein
MVVQVSDAASANPTFRVSDQLSVRTRNLTSVTDRNGRQTTYGYDAADRLTGETWVNSSPAYTATLTYDAANDLTAASDPYSSYQYTYDSEGRLSTVSDVCAHRPNTGQL